MAEEEEFEEDEESNEDSFEDIQEIIDQTPTAGFRSHSLSEIIPTLGPSETGVPPQRGFQRMIITDDNEEEEQVSYDTDSQKKGAGETGPPINEYRPQDDYASEGSGDYSSFTSASPESGQRMIGESRQVFGRGPSGIPESNWGAGGTGSGMDSIGRDNLSGNMNMGAGTQNKNYEDDQEKRMKDKKRTM